MSKRPRIERVSFETERRVVANKLILTATVARGSSKLPISTELPRGRWGPARSELIQVESLSRLTRTTGSKSTAAGTAQNTGIIDRKEILKWRPSATQKRRSIPESAASSALSSNGTKGKRKSLRSGASLLSTFGALELPWRIKLW